MSTFFNYQSPYRTGIFYDLSVAEYWIPIITVFLLAVLLYRYRNIFKKSQRLDRNLRIIIGIIFAIVYSSHYIFRFAIYGFDTIVLPFQLCSVSMFLAIILLFTKNRTIYTFVLVAGLGGGLISFFNPVLGYNSSFYRYYQFMIAHGILILTPLYFLFVHSYYPKKKEILHSFYILQSLAIFMMIFNYYMDTDFMFLFLDPAKIDKFPSISKFGGIPYYIILVEFVGMAYFYLFYVVIHLFEKKQVPDVLYEQA